jgi:hypothetical protein
VVEGLIAIILIVALIVLKLDWEKQREPIGHTGHTDDISDAS